MKKILAIALAAATAVSMFATSVSAAIDYADETAYNAGYYAVKLTFGTDKITVNQKYIDATTGTEANITAVEVDDISELTEFVDHLVFDEVASVEVENYTTAKANESDLPYGNIYMYDYEKDLEAKAADKYDDYDEDFKDILDDIRSSTASDPADVTVAEFIAAWGKVYNKEPQLSADDYTDLEGRYDVVRTAIANAKYVKSEFCNKTTGNLNTAEFDAEDLDLYNAAALLNAVKAVAKLSDTTALYTSELVYLNREYERVINEIAFADVSEKMTEYYEALEDIAEYVEDDFTATNWRLFQERLEEAEEAAAEAETIADWTEAIELLEKADEVKGKPADYEALEEALLALFVDDSTSALANVNNKVYKGDDATKYIYEKESFKVSAGKYSVEWQEFAGNDAAGNYDDEPSAYTEAWTMYKDLRTSRYNAKQSAVDTMVAELNDAVDALVANNDVDAWLLVKLEGIVETADALVETDFNTATRKWADFQEDVEDAKATLAKANPSEGEVNRVTAALEASLVDIMDSARNVTAADKKELKDLIKEATKLLDNVTTQTGAQVAALREAANEATLVDFTATGLDTVTVSMAKTAIADLAAAIANFNNPQGWYLVDGNWFYGAGAETYADGWYQIGSTWFMFNADGSMKAAEWFMVDGKWYYANANGGLAIGWANVDGNWYFFDQGNAMKTGWVKVDNNWYYLASSGAMVTGWNWIGGNCYYFYANGAMAANTTVGGYKVDANGAWVA